MKSLTALLFTGGESRRMGVDKAALVVQGEPLWARQLRLLRELSPEVILISARTKPAWCPPEIGIVLDEPPSRGPLSGLAAGLKHSQTTHLLALAIDLPEMTPPHLKKLWALARPGTGVVPKNGERFEPLSAIYSLESRSAAEEALAGADVSMHRLVRILAARKQVVFYRLTQHERTAYQNFNEPGQ